MQIPKLKEGQLIECLWHDAGRVCDPWIELCDIDYEQAESDLMGIQTAGYFLKKTDYTLFLCMTYAKDQCLGVFGIPLKAIRILEKK